MVSFANVISISVTLSIFNFCSNGSVSASCFAKHIVLTTFFCNLMILLQLKPHAPCHTDISSIVSKDRDMLGAARDPVQ